MYVCPLADSAAGRNSTLLNTASDGFGIIYSSPAMANKPMRVLGYIEWNSPGLAAVGTWTITNLRCVQLMGLGVRLPGQVVQVDYRQRQQYSDMVGRWAGEPVSVYGGFVCYDACNPVRVTAQVILWPDIASGQTAVARLYREPLRHLSAAWCKSQEMWALPLLLTVCWSVGFSQHGLAFRAVSYYAKFYATGGTAISALESDRPSNR